MKKTLLSIAVIASAIAAVSCQKEIVSGNDSQLENAPVFTAAIDQVNKTTIESTATEGRRKVFWVDGDKISVNGAVYSATAKSEDATKATFTLVSGDAPVAPFKAYYPETVWADTISVLPAVQVYEAGKFNAPMYAESEDCNLNFKNICAVLAITVKEADMATVKKIRVASGNKAMSGKFSVEEGKAVLDKKGDTDKDVILDCGDGVTTTAAGTEFYIAVPEGSYNDLLIELSSDGTNFTKSMVSKPYYAVEIKAGTRYPLVFEEATLLYVDGNYKGAAIFLDGVWWAPVNCGYDKNNLYGKFFQWGRHDGGNYTNSNNIQAVVDGPVAAEDEDPAKFYKATTASVDKDWLLVQDDFRWRKDGKKTIYDPCPSGWRVPTDAELKPLITGYRSEFVKRDGINGYYFSGSEEYSEGVPCVYLHAAGYRAVSNGNCSNATTDGQYWTSSTYPKTRYATRGQFNDHEAKMNTGGIRGNAISVRCVKDDE